MAPPFVASTELPQCFPLSGDLLDMATAPELPPPPVAPGTVPLRRPGKKAAAPHAPGPRARLLRSCIEEIGVLGNVLTNRDEDRFTPGLVRFEERLLKDLDALVNTPEIGQGM